LADYKDDKKKLNENEYFESKRTNEKNEDIENGQNTPKP
jgi:hypothetical protein